MAWPTVAVDTTGMDNDTDGLPRSAILDLTTKFNDLIAMRGMASGVCDLDGAGLVPVARIPAAIARLASPALSGTPTAPTAALGTNSTQLATTAFALANGLLNGVIAKSAAYTVVAADRGKLVDYTISGHTLSLTDAATLGAGFAFAVRNSSSGNITVDPNGSEQIDGATTIALASGESCFMVCDGIGWKTTRSAGGITSSTAVTASGTAVDFTGIPSGVRRITVVVSGLSTNGSSNLMIQIGDSGGFETSGYSGAAGNRAGETYSTAGMLITAGSSAPAVRSATFVLNLVGGSTWVGGGVNATSGADAPQWSSSSKTLSDELTQIRVTTVGGVDVFDAGTININYE